MLNVENSRKRKHFSPAALSALSGPSGISALGKWQLSPFRCDIIVAVTHTLSIVGKYLVAKMFGMSIMEVLLSRN